MNGRATSQRVTPASRAICPRPMTADGVSDTGGIQLRTRRPLPRRQQSSMSSSPKHSFVPRYKAEPARKMAGYIL